ncbi:uncharacterized protein ank2a isoform X6 [Hypomesus transpacificus]|uniref:uncharacterized protein ank2a isoform X6 n=1 Tax=Hypomesus transpacificus TaxID=137520 RepID=UPI001F079E3E|nr:uncharacterized protein ank2a isoform X6 [Hypomesus transpacificus]
MSPLSVSSHLEFSGFYLEDLFDENRPHSPESCLLKGGYEESYEISTMLRPLSPDSLTSENQYILSFLEYWISESRPSSPESEALFTEYQPLCPDSPVPQFRPLPPDWSNSYCESRSSSPESLISDVEYSEEYVEAFDMNARPLSPEPIVFHFIKRTESYMIEFPAATSVSPESGVLRSHAKPLVPLSETFDMNDRPPSPEQIVFPFMKSPTKTGYIQLDLSNTQFWSLQLPPFSAIEDSLDEWNGLAFGSNDKSEVKIRPDSLSSFNDSREPVPSELDYSDLCFKEQLAENRPDTPESYASHSDLAGFMEMTQTLHSPKLLTSKVYFHPMSKISKIKSLSSFDEDRPLSPDSPTPHFRAEHCDYYLHFSGSCPLLTQSFSSDIESFEWCHEELFTGEGQDSPDSVMPTSQSVLYIDKANINDRPLSPESLTSENSFSFPQFWFSSTTCSPDSVRSLDEYQPLSPDSPVPQFETQCCDYYLFFTSSTSSSPESIASDHESCGLNFDAVFTENRADSPETFISEGEDEHYDDIPTIFRPFSPDSLTSENEYSLSFLEYCFSELRPSSPESMTSLFEYRPLSPDSPVPQFAPALSIFTMTTAGRSSPSESVMSETDWEEFCLEDVFSEVRPCSPDSIWSDSEDIADALEAQQNQSNQKPKTQMTETNITETTCPHENVIPLSQVNIDLSEGSFTAPEDVGLSETPLTEQKADATPLSQVMCDVYKGRTLTTEYTLVYKAVQCKLMAHMNDPLYKGETYKSKTGVFECAGGGRQGARRAVDIQRETLNKARTDIDEEPKLDIMSDSEIVILKETEVIESQQTESEDLFDEKIGDDSSLTDFKADKTIIDSEDVLDSSLPVMAEIRSPSPVLFEWEFVQLSPLPEYQPLSPESFNSDNDENLLHLNHLFTDMRPSSPDSVASLDEYRLLLPDSPVPQFRSECCHYYLSFTGNRVSSPESVVSDLEYSDVCLEELVTEKRPDSPESITSTKSVLERKSPKHRPLSPESITSDDDLLLFEPWFSENMTCSPDSVRSLDEYQPLSPDSPVPQFETQCCDYYLFFTHSTSSSPESIASDHESCGLNFDAVFTQNRADSPETFISKGEDEHCDDIPTIFRPFSPDSLTSENDYPLSFLEYCFSELRPSSPESMTSLFEYRPLSPDSPVPQFAPALSIFTMTTAGRSSPPESVMSETDWEEFCLEDVFSEVRPCSPDSIWSDSEDIAGALEAQQNQSNQKPKTQMTETNITETTCPHENVIPLSQVNIDLSEGRFTAPEDVGLSETPLTEQQADVTPPSQVMCDVYKGRTLTTEYTLVYKAVQCKLMAHMNDPLYKGETYKSKTGVFECTGGGRQGARRAVDIQRETLNKARIHIDEEPKLDIMSDSEIVILKETEVIESQQTESEDLFDEKIGDYSSLTDFKADKTIIDSEDVLDSSLPVMAEIRSPSPVLFEWEFVQLSLLPEYQPLSPESFNSDNDENLLHLNHLFTDLRPSSPDSVASLDEYRLLSSDSPVPQFRSECCHYYLSFTGNRVSSPESVVSDLEYSDVCLEELVTEKRPDSPESITSTKCVLERKSPKHRPLSPESITSDDDLLLFEPWFSENMTCSPDSVRSLDEYQPLTPDSPVPQFETQCCDYYLFFTSSTSTSPESVGSDHEFSGVNFDAVLTENRAGSPETFISEGEDERCCDIPTIFRPFSPDSLTSENDYSLSFLENWFSELRPSSPESMTSLCEYRPLSPDSPVPQFAPALSIFTMTTAGRSSQPESVMSETDWEEFCLEDLSSEVRPCSPDSIWSNTESATNQHNEKQSPTLHSKQDFLEYDWWPDVQSEHRRPNTESNDAPFTFYFHTCCQTHRIVEQFFCRASSPHSTSKPCNDVEQMTSHRIDPSSSELSHVPSGKHHEGSQAVWLEEAFPVQHQTSTQSKYSRGSRVILKWIHPEVKPGIEPYSNNKDLARLMMKEKNSRVSLLSADEMPDLPPQTVTEEHYTDEHGHMVVKKVTRKIIRKCVSADGMEREEVTVEGSPQGSVSVAEGDSYSRVVKRTVLRSEGDHTEVTFTDGVPGSGEELLGGHKVSRVEQTSVVEGERRETHHGDPSLTSDLPSAREDFSMALGYIGGFSRVQLPNVVEREIVNEDGSVSRRARMRKGRTQRRTVVRGAGRSQVLLERLDDVQEGSRPRDLQQHLHQLIHSYCKEEGEEEEERKD